MDHLIASLCKYYDVKVDLLEGKEFVKINHDWDYDNGKVHLSMEPYREKALHQFNNLVPSMSPQNMGLPNSTPNTTTPHKLVLRNRNMFNKLMGNGCGMAEQ